MIARLLAIFSALIVAAPAQADNAPQTADLDFLIGDWNVTRVNRPGQEGERTFTGSLTCEPALEGQYIRCVYYFERDDRGPIHDEVFFNYNSIYGTYESLWVSATWPIKNTMRAEPGQSPDAMTWTSEFLIENGVREYVRSFWNVSDAAGFSRRTDIRTSEYADGEWLHWMNEIVEPASSTDP